MPHTHQALLDAGMPRDKASPLAIRATEEVARFSLRLDPAALSLAATAFGAPLPARIGQTSAEAGRLALMLGPDEWHLLVPLSDGDAVAAAFEGLATPHSLVDIGHRDVGIVVEGAAATLALRSAIAFDVDAMPVGTGRRTLFDKAQIILIRDAQDRFRLEVWRSFADHVRGILQAADREIALGI